MANNPSPSRRRDLRELSTETLESVARGLTSAIKALEILETDASPLKGGLADVEKELIDRLMEPPVTDPLAGRPSRPLHRFCFGGE